MVWWKVFLVRNPWSRKDDVRLMSEGCEIVRLDHDISWPWHSHQCRSARRSLFVAKSRLRWICSPWYCSFLGSFVEAFGCQSCQGVHRVDILPLKCCETGKTNRGWEAYVLDSIGGKRCLYYLLFIEFTCASFAPSILGQDCESWFWVWWRFQKFSHGCCRGRIRIWKKMRTCRLKEHAWEYITGEFKLRKQVWTQSEHVRTHIGMRQRVWPFWLAFVYQIQFVSGIRISLWH